MRFATALAVSTTLAAGALPAGAETYIYGSWVPASDYINSDALPEVFRRIEEETNGSVQWNLIAGGQLAGGVETFSAIQDGLMAAGVAAANYVPNLLPSISMLYGTAVPGDDPVAAAGAANEVMMLHCPSCLEEARDLNQVPFAGYASAPYMLMCIEPVDEVSQLEGLRVRASGAPLNILETVGASTVSASLTEAVSLLQRGGLDCTTGIGDWLKTFGYGDFAKYVTDFSLGVSAPIVAMMINRDVWNGFTTEEREAHLRHMGYLAADHTINNFIIGTEEVLQDQIANNGVQMVEVGDDWQEMMDAYKAQEYDMAAEEARQFGVEDPEAILEAYAEALEKWRGLSEEIGTDTDLFAQMLWDEVYSKVDPDSL